ncbi:16S rRNA (uracil(1498)-N(3))-methyltransferase [Moraxella lacunata]|uniref:Ribosomal RNA small subunit methyltransferase E n=1 Tax=Moraxella lacunata TaxID=477 RepID=A0A1V4GZH8_MORLA|nr:16S rRNA (uracil(1498)-N(3))-methyltransferase [Moraxella lacunata]OPH37993.1 16S rRNA (uracil(1498)-N(3))-methyltransferase [Moraxella lacunata]
MNIIILPPSAFDDTTAMIGNADQLNHIKTVLKASVGDTLKIGKMGDKMGVGQIAYIDDKICTLENIRLDTGPPSKLGVTVMLALPRPKVLRRLIMDMTAFGVHHIILINSIRTDKSYWGSPLLARLDEFVLEGLQQGVDSVPPIITLAKRFKPFVQDELPGLINDKSALVFHPYAKTSFTSFVSKNPLPKIIIIGAEGGFVPYEIDLLASVGVQSVNMGERILRTESAVNAVLGRWV